MSRKVVLAALALLAPALAGSSRQVTAQTQIEILGSALIFFQMDNGRYPTTEEGLAALVEAPPALRGSNTYRAGGYLVGGAVPRDPWGNPFQYVSPAVRSDEGYDLWSLGADGVPGGEELDADLGNWPGGFAAARRYWNLRAAAADALFDSIAGVVLGVPIYLAVGVVGWWRGRGLRSAFLDRSLVILLGAVLLCVSSGLCGVGMIE